MKWLIKLEMKVQVIDTKRRLYSNSNTYTTCFMHIFAYYPYELFSELYSLRD